MAILGVEVNVVLARRLWPRALLTPFTDAVDLTEADRRAYAMYAQMQRHKGFETVVVRFDGRDGDTHEIVLEPDKRGPDLHGLGRPARRTRAAADAPVEQHPGERDRRLAADEPGRVSDQPAQRSRSRRARGRRAGSRRPSRTTPPPARSAGVR